MVDSLMPQWDKSGRDWQITDEDRRMIAGYVDWLPSRVFDAHGTGAAAT